MARNGSAASGRKGIVDKLFLDHPRSLGMSWAGHGAGALKVGFQLIGAGCAAIIHGLVPGLFGETASRTVTRVYEHIERTRGATAHDS